jgi:antitoxin (DNA-binding transcriptional repressor) of toxin-antitoxin stability system
MWPWYYGYGHKVVAYRHRRIHVAVSRKKSPAASTSLDGHDVVEVKAGVFKDTCLQLLDQVHDQEIEVVVTKRGEIVARVIPPDARAPSAFGFMRGTLLAYEDIVAPDVEAWGDFG